MDQYLIMLVATLGAVGVLLATAPGARSWALNILGVRASAQSPTRAEGTRITAVRDIVVDGGEGDSSLTDAAAGRDISISGGDPKMRR